MNPTPENDADFAIAPEEGGGSDGKEKAPKTVKLRKMPRNNLLRIIADFDGGLIPGADDPKVVEFVKKCRLELARRVANLHASVKGRRVPAQTPKKKRRKGKR